jgi:uncharacterized protein (DUF427 family)
MLGPHPKDPYKRVDCLASCRPAWVHVDGDVIVHTMTSVFVFETGKPTRYYFSAPSVLDSVTLLPSDTKTICPYKGEASWYHVRVSEGRVIEDGAWCYPYPTAEAAQIKGLICFDTNKVEVELITFH